MKIDVLVLCGTIATLGTAVGIIHRMIKPFEDKIKQIDDNSRHLENDNKRLMELEEGTRIIYQTLLAMVSHEIDGNNIEELKKVKKNLEDYLIKR